MLFAVLLFLELFFLPETLYPRRAMTGINGFNVSADDVDANNARDPASPIEIKRTKQLGYFVSTLPSLLFMILTTNRASKKSRGYLILNR